MFTSLLWIISAAEAGCALDTDQPARWAAAPLIVEGTITDIVIRDGAVMEYLQVDTTHKGALATDGLWLRTQLPYTGCPGPIVFAPGTRIYAVGTPSADQAIDISPCRPDVGRSDLLQQDLSAVAAQQPQTAGQFLGADWQRMFAPLPPLTDGDGRHAVLLRDGIEYQGAVLSEAPGTVSLLVDAGDLELLFRARDTELVPVVTSDWPLAPGSALRWRAGATIASDGHPRLPPEWSGAQPLPAEGVGVFWTPGPDPVPPPGDAHTMVSPGRVALHAAPAGEVLLHWDVGLPTVVAQSEQAHGWRQIWLEKDVFFGSAWVSEDALAASSVEGGYPGGVMGGISSRELLRIRVPAGVVLRRADGAALGRAKRTTSLGYLVDDGELAWVTIPWQSGVLVGTVPCAPDGASAGICRVAAP